eukprot:2360444-Rhodomonas_salina.1
MARKCRAREQGSKGAREDGRTDGDEVARHAEVERLASLAELLQRQALRPLPRHAASMCPRDAVSARLRALALAFEFELFCASLDVALRLRLRLRF